MFALPSLSRKAEAAGAARTGDRDGARVCAAQRRERVPGGRGERDDHRADRQHDRGATVHEVRGEQATGGDDPGDGIDGGFDRRLVGAAKLVPQRQRTLRIGIDEQAGLRRLDLRS